MHQDNLEQRGLEHYESNGGITTALTFVEPIDLGPGKATGFEAPVGLS
jgi:hypothetical protein